MKKLAVTAFVAFLTCSSVASASGNPFASIQASIDALSAQVGELGAGRIGIEDVVVLTWVSPGAGVPTFCKQTNKEFRQIYPDGSFADEVFVVPEGKIFVATDVDAVIVAGIGNTFNVGSTVHAVLQMEANANSGLVPHTTSGVPVTNPLQEAVSVSSKLHTGILIGAGQQVCVRGDERSGNTGFIFRSVTSASVRGYLVNMPE